METQLERLFKRNLDSKAAKSTRRHFLMDCSAGSGLAMAPTPLFLVILDSNVQSKGLKSFRSGS